MLAGKVCKLTLLSLLGVTLCALVSYVAYTPRALLFNEVKASQQVVEAIAQNKPLLALESTIITHGLPYPTNVELQLELQNIARENGATPATIAILNGVPTVGLTDDEIMNLGPNKNALKSSAYDIRYAEAFNRTASTTVAATSRLAQSLGINVFSTGGIGGVHRFDQKYEFDVSADLTELSKTDVLVVSAGCKAILDLRGTAEVLETNEVLTVGYQTNEMPAFYSRESGIKLDYKVDDTMEAAKLYTTGDAHHHGYLLFNPIPKEAEIKREDIEPYILEALGSMPENVTGKAVTPYLLGKMKEITNDKSVEANLALIKNNVAIGAQIARDIKKIQDANPKRNPVLLIMAKMGLTCYHETFVGLVVACAGLLIALFM